MCWELSICLRTGAAGPCSRTAEDLKPVPCLQTITRGLHPALWCLSDLTFLFQVRLL